MTPLERLRALLAGEEPPPGDALLGALLAEAEAFLLARCNRAAMPPGLTAAQVRLALYWYARRGMEGEQSHGEGGVTRAMDALPADIQAMTTPFVLVKLAQRIKEEAQ
jgi:hypothetical protein